MAETKDAAATAPQAETEDEAATAAKFAVEDPTTDDAANHLAAANSEGSAENGAAENLAAMAPAEDEPDVIIANPDDEEDDDADVPAAAMPECSPGAGFALASRIRLSETEALIEHLRAVPADVPLAIDARSVESLSTTAVLALVAAARIRAQAGRPLAVEQPSAAFVDAFSDLGLFQDLMKMEFRT